MGRERAAIGLVYRVDTNWIAGAYYVQNIAKALKQCDDSRLPQIVLFCDSEQAFADFEHATGYPYLQMRLIHPKLSYPRRFMKYHLPKISQMIWGCPNHFPTPHDKVKFVYPMVEARDIEAMEKALFWIPDFQEKHLTQFFSAEELAYRENKIQQIVAAKSPIVFSSLDAQKDFFTYYPAGKQLKTFVLPFAVSHPSAAGEEIVALKEKFGITDNYLFCANQFWAHKNHLMLFKAFKKALDQGLKLQLVCSGKMADYRNPDYIAEVKQFLEENDMEKHIRLLGFIERSEQVCLMQHSYAIVQPSLFEGWSTVVEDAKCMNKFLFLSNLGVHLEQNPENVCFFDPHNIEDLADKLLHVKPTDRPFDYDVCVRQMGENFLQIVEQL